MRITLEIPDVHAPALFEFLAELIDCGNRIKERKAEDYEPTKEQTVTVPLVESRSLTAAPELPMPADLPKLPPLPEGKSRWAYLGMFDDEKTTKDVQSHHGRTISYWSENRNKWYATFTLSGVFHHIEAI